MAAERLVVIGGDAAGLCPAAQAPTLNGPAELGIVAVERAPWTTYNACGKT
ncbi:FAD-dependent oxidoreductase, partial [Streptomyces bacillaris]